MQEWRHVDDPRTGDVRWVPASAYLRVMHALQTNPDAVARHPLEPRETYRDTAAHERWWRENQPDEARPHAPSEPRDLARLGHWRGVELPVAPRCGTASPAPPRPRA